MQNVHDNAEPGFNRGRQGMESKALTRTIETGVHGRYLLRVPRTPGPWPVLYSFHGYGEDAATNLTAVERIPGVDDWLVVAVQALHPFYAKNERVVASWMTRQDRELAIADNLRYVRAVVDAVARECHVTSSMVFAGFSQGVAMAYRAAASIPAAAVIALAGDVPPDLTSMSHSPNRPVLPHVLIGRGTADGWYTEEKMAADAARLKELASHVETCVFTGGHEWTDAFAEAAGAFLTRLRNAPWFVQPT
jgi:predicted esterase